MKNLTTETAGFNCLDIKAFILDALMLMQSGAENADPVS